jgi:hypothetical protein
MGKKKNKVREVDAATKQAYNYAVISRHDTKLAQVFFTSAICNVYKFDIEAGEWDKLNCQGTLFIYSRVARESSDVGDAKRFPYGLMVLNRLSLDNFILGLTPVSISAKTDEPEMEVELEDPFIMIQAADGAMYGLWLFHEADRSVAETTIAWCLNQQMS